MFRNQKGQALIEFIIILPVIIFLIFSFIDLGRIILENNRLESLTTTVVNKYKETNSYSDVLSYIRGLGYDDVNLSLKIENNMLIVKMDRGIDIITPGLSNVIGDSYTIEVERVVGYE